MNHPIYTRMLKRIAPSAVVSTAVAVVSVLSSSAWGISYGTYDSRAMAMGSVGVAAGNTENAVFYNPALLSFHDGDEDDTRDGRLFLPIVVVQASGAYNETADIADQDLDGQLSTAVNNFNADQSAANAGQVSAALDDVNGAIDDIAGDDITLDNFIGFNVSEPGDREGGAFFFGVRIVGGGRALVPDEDRAVVARYQSAMDTIAAGGTTDDIDPDLVDEDGNLIDPNESLSSSVDIGVVALTEWGVAFSKEVNVFGVPVSFGATPKAVRVDVYRESRGYSDGDLNFDDKFNYHYTFNGDVGVAVEFADHYRVGLAVKDVVPHDFEAVRGEDEPLDAPAKEVTLRPRTRLGVAYTTEMFQVGMDVDVHEIESLAGEAPFQDAAIGVEFTPFWGWDFRAGYQMDMTGVRDYAYSAGVAYKVTRFAFEFSYMKGASSEGVGAQFGWAF